MIERDTDVAVVGLGVLGSATLYHLARSGLAPHGLEQFALHHPYGSSHGESRTFRLAYTDPFYVSLALEAQVLWTDLARRVPDPILTTCGMVSFARANNRALHTTASTLTDHDVTHELLGPTELRDRFALHLSNDRVGCYVPAAGYLHARNCVKAHVELGIALGARVTTNIRVDAIDLDTRTPVVITDHGRLRCRRLVVCAGPWTAQLLSQFGAHLTVTKQDVHHLTATDPDALRHRAIPVYGDLDTRFYGFPPSAQAAIKVADGNLGPRTDPDTVNRVADPTAGSTLRRWAAGLFPTAGLQPVRSDVCLYTMAPKRDFVLGTLPDHDAVAVAAGMSGHGFKFASVLGKLLADLVTDGTPHTPLRRFHPGLIADR